MSNHPYDALTPDRILDAIDSALAPLGQMASGHLLALNSYENRVYQVGVDDAPSVVVKFYRPERWSRQAIQEEHQFALECAEEELPVVPPLLIEGKSVFEYQGFLFSLYPKQGGHSGQIESLDDFEQMGRLLGRLHQVGKRQSIHARPQLDPASFGRQAIQTLRDSLRVDPQMEQQYFHLAEEAVTLIEQRWQTLNPRLQLVHGDLHAGNLLWTHTQDQHVPHMVDLDDCRLAPAMQDIWMLCHGDTETQRAQIHAIANGYETFAEFPWEQLPLIEPLRTLRFIHYSAWLAERWDDPAFPQAFTWFESAKYWSDEIMNLREQISLLQEPILNF